MIINANYRHQFSSLSCENGLITLSVIVPAYNEEARIVPMLTDTINYLDERKKKDG
jgi:cellulose synthase/poly-beta-1,6-N-acetylglucosamine synthase-like glycosyltransferase